MAAEGFPLCYFGQASRGTVPLFGENKRAPVHRHVKLNLTAR